MSIKKPIYQHGFLGAGKMAEVLVRALLQSGLAKPKDILLSRTSKSALKRLQKGLKVSVTEDNIALATQSRWVWLGIKPFQAQAVLREIAPHLRKDSVLLSMLAGISTQTLRRTLGPGPRLVRFMPNTPALIGRGMTGVFFGKSTPAPIRLKTLRLLGALGKTLEVKQEAQLDAVTGLSGSGPAFVYYLADALAEGGRMAGLKQKEAQLLAYQTLFGAVGMLQSGNLDPEGLIAQVLSKGGTTEAGLKILESGNVGEKVSQAVLRAARRAAEIKEENECSR